MRLTTVCKIIAKTFFNSFPVIYSWIGLLPKISQILELCQGNFFLEQLILLPTAEALGTTFFRSIIHTLVLGILKFQHHYP
jgi:hypothetical protein